MFNYKFFLSLTVILALQSFACGGPGLSGVFVPREKNRVTSVEFKDGSARFTDSFLGIKQGRMEFTVKGDTVKINDPFTGTLIFKIIDADTLFCEIKGMSGLFVRQK